MGELVYFHIHRSIHVCSLPTVSRDLSFIPLGPLTAQPAVEKVNRGIGLVHGDHVTGLENAHESQVTTGLDLSVRLALLAVLRSKGQVLKLGLGKVLVAGPVELVGPGLVAEPVADEVNVASVDENGKLLEDLGDELVVGLHPVTGEHEVAVDVKVAAVVAINLGANGVIDVKTGALVRSHHGVVAVDGGRHARPGAAGGVAVLDQGLAAGQGAVHAVTLRLAEHGLVATLAASHGAVVRVLGVGIGQTVADQDALEVDVAVLVLEDLGGEDGNIVTSVGFTSNVEVLLLVLGELVEEKGKESVDILAGSDSVANAVAGVRVADVNGLVEEDDGGVVVPCSRVALELKLLGDGGGAELKEQTGQRRAAGAAVEPEDDGVVLGVVAGLEEPVEEVLVLLVVVEVPGVLLDARVDAQA